MMGQFIDKTQGIVYTAVMLNDGEYTIYKERLRLGLTEELLETWTIPESVAFAILDLFERGERAAKKRIPCDICGRDTLDTGEPCGVCMNSVTPEEEYFAYIKSDSYIAYLNRN
jgi:hypothetical protein